MSKLTRKLMKLFGENAGTNQIAQFGSLAANTPTFVNDGNPDTIQGLAAWLSGWYGAVIGGNSPAIQDVNSVFYVFAYQLVYLFQAGVPEWNSATTYYVGSIVNDGSGNLYTSIADDNTNNALSDQTKWLRNGSPIPTTIDPGTQSPYVISSANDGATFLVNTAAGAQTFTLPAAIPGMTFTVKDVGGEAAVNEITLTPNGSDTIEFLAANLVLSAGYGVWTIRGVAGGWVLV
jgi:hypothetical protein